MRNRQGERGKTGDHGQDGQDGQDGQTGATGATGLNGRSLTLWQALSMFLLILIIGLTLGLHLERQQDEILAQQATIDTQQAKINENAREIVKAQDLACRAARRNLDALNNKNRRLMAVERKLMDNPEATDVGRMIARERIKAYEAGLIDPLPNCKER